MAALRTPVSCSATQGWRERCAQLPRAERRPITRGRLPKRCAAVVQEAGGCLSVADLAAHSSTWETPISVPYRGLRVWECPPNGQGLAALLALNILQGFELTDLPALSTGRLHLLIEAMRLAFADTRWYVADPATNPAPLAWLLSPEYAAERRKLIDPKRATLDQRRGAPTASSDTVYLCTVDAAGNACSFINSNYMGFGTGIVPQGWGFTLQNRGHNFSLEAGHPNALAPGKRPYHTIIPGMMTVDSGQVTVISDQLSVNSDQLPVDGNRTAISEQPQPSAICYPPYAVCAVWGDGGVHAAAGARAGSRWAGGGWAGSAGGARPAALLY